MRGRPTVCPVAATDANPWVPTVVEPRSASAPSRPTTGLALRAKSVPLPPDASLAPCYLQPSPLGIGALALCAWLWVGAPASSLAGGMPLMQQTQLADLSLEQLRDVLVSTTSRGDEALEGVAASVYVISADDIRRSGATTLPEALRLAPTLNVARADGHQYAISARGFGNLLHNKLLVLIDGRTVYTPLFSGVIWEAQQVMLQDVERIEVVTGASTALWGTNAVNALVHVITRSAAATAGLAATLQAGHAGRSAALRWGGGQSSGAAWRAYVQSYQHSSTELAGGLPLHDPGHGVQAGWRADWEPRGHRITLQGDAYRGRIPQPGFARRFSGANLVANWQHSPAPHWQSSAQLVVDHTEREQGPGFLNRLATLDLVAQQAITLDQRQQLVLGAGLRRANDRSTTDPSFALVPAKRAMWWRRVFAQDRWQVTPALALTAAASVESNPYTGFETLPSLRAAWAGSEHGLLWASVSRAVRAPSRLDRDLFVPAQPPYAIAGGPDFRSEVSNVAELGWRAQPMPTLSYALTLYRMQHTRLRSLAPMPQGAQWQNNNSGRTQGLEAWVRARPLARWRLEGGFTLLSQRLQANAGTLDLAGLAALGNSPRHQSQLRSSVALGAGWHWDADLRRVGALPDPAVPAYTALDTRLSWFAAPDVEWTLGVQNLGDTAHAEWGVLGKRAVFKRAAFLRLRLWQH
jgi:iron complex outermembrane recepter protein